ncbi:MAG: S-layer homology domain-containing protein [Oscillospiraceae bacterium]|nr:S-layer homology domain-containing protein [Oscillospiraceae bacterium]
MKSKSNVAKRLLAVVLAALMVAGALPNPGATGVGSLLAPLTANADGGPVGDVIFNEPYAPALPPVSSLSDIQWSIVDHPGHDIAYTEAQSQAHNGAATLDHVVMQNDDIAFYGYAYPAYVDSVFTDLYEVNGISFVLRPVIMNFHTFSEAGFLFNGEFNYVGSRMYYTGYAVVLKCGNVAGMLENSPAAANTASLCLYYIDNEEWIPGNFRPGNVATTRTLVSVLKTGINNLDPTPYRLSLEVDNATRAFQLYLDGAFRADVPAADVEGGAAGPTGFGFYTGYYSHACSILTRIRFENTLFDIEVEEKETGASVLFVDALSGAEIRAPEIVDDGLSGQRYKVVQPRFINATEPGFHYVLSNNSRGVDIENDMLLTYHSSPLRNVTTLYYTMQYEGDVTDLFEKKARVNGGNWDNGEVSNPVLVINGDEIEYEITVYSQPGGQSGYGEVRDTIPNGLEIDKTSITGTESAAPIPGSIAWRLEDSDRTIVWTIPVDMYPVSVSVKVEVDNTINEQTMFENFAMVMIASGFMETNITYHEFTNIKIIEEYYFYDEVTDLPTSDKMPYPDLETYIRFGSIYTVQGLPEAQARMYIFKGYSYFEPGSQWSFIPAESLDEIPEIPDEEMIYTSIQLYYMPVYVTVHFVDEAGNPIADAPNGPSVQEMVLPYADYFIKMSYFDSFATSSNQIWTYYDFELVSPPQVGSGRTLGAEPVYPSGSAPIFDGDIMDSSKHIILYFTLKQAVRVHYRELNNPGNVLHNTGTYFFDSIFDPSVTLRSPGGDALRDDIDLTAAFGKVYEYTDVYTVDGGLEQAGFPGVQGAPSEITLYFRTSYLLTEKFHKDEDSDEEEDLKLLADAVQEIFGGGSFTGDPPAFIIVGTQKWNYIGYKVDNGSNPLNTGIPSIGRLTGDAVIIYIFELDPDPYEETTTTPTPPPGGTPGGSPGGSPGGTPATPAPTPTPTPTPAPTPTPTEDIGTDRVPLSPFITDHVAYIIGYPEGDVRPGLNVTRAEVATVFFRLLTDDFRGDYWTRDNPYSDVQQSDWFNTAVSVMNNMGIIRGYPEGHFTPDGDITRAELATVAARFAAVMQTAGSNSVDFSDIAEHWAETEIVGAAAIGWVNGYPDSTFRPDQPITRAEFMTLVNRVLERVPENYDDLLGGEMAQWPDNMDRNAWYYLAVQEATNSHDAVSKSTQVPGLGFNYEQWTNMTENRDWLAMETIWLETYSAR